MARLTRSSVRSGAACVSSSSTPACCAIFSRSRAVRQTSSRLTPSGCSRERFDAGVRFVLPITTIVETGNFIAQCGGDRRSAAQRFDRALAAAASESPPWLIHDVAWNSEFVNDLLAGNATGTSLIEHFTAKTLGAGDLTILVERDRYAATRSFDTVEIWTTDAGLSAY